LCAAKKPNVTRSFRLQIVMYVLSVRRVFLNVFQSGLLMEKAVSLKEMAEILDVGETHLRNQIKKLRVPHFKVGSLYRFFPSKVIAWYEENTEQVSQSPKAPSGKKGPLKHLDP